MATTVEIITAAFRKIGVASTGNPITAEETDEGLDALNRMMHGFKLRAVDLEHADLTTADDFPLSPEFHEGIVYLLAQRLSPDYMLPASFDADDWFRTFQAAYCVLPEIEPTTTFAYLPSARKC